MDIGILHLGTVESVDVAILAKRAEQMEFHSLWVPEHPIIPVDTKETVPDLYRQFPDPFVSLAIASAVTERLKLGTAVCLVPERTPLVLAKEIASLDMYSHGRFLFGVGAGWLKEECEIMGGNFEYRWTQTIEAIKAMKKLWVNDVSEFHGKYYDFAPVYHYPKPVNCPYPPILLGSKSSLVFERIIAEADGWIPIDACPKEVETGRRVLDKLAIDAGRNPLTIQIVVADVSPERQQIKDFENAGANVAIVGSRSPDRQWTLLELERTALSVLQRW